MKKIICFLINISLLLCVIGVSSTSIVNDNLNRKEFLNDDILDQAQIVVEDGLPVGNFQLPDNPRYNWSIAQSFTPGLVIFTRVKLLLARNSIPPTIHPLIMTIRKTIDGENLASVSVDPQEVPEFPDYDWIEFDIVDMPVEAGEDYYIICYTNNDTDNTYVWGTNPNDPYQAGQVYISLDNGATWDGDAPADTADMCFMTYGRNNSFPDIPIIDGSKSGKIGTTYTYNISATDPDGDDIAYYLILWDDDTHTNLTGPFASGELVTAAHKWTKEKTYSILVRATDVFGKDSYWGELDVTIPRNRVYLRLLDMFPILERILRFIR